MRDHVLRVHTVENVKCSVCEKIFKNAKVLKAHNDTVHGEKVPRVHCGKLFGVKNYMWSQTKYITYWMPLGLTKKNFWYL